MILKIIYLDTRLRKWTVVTHFPEFIEEAPRAYHAVVYDSGWLYLIGGFDGQHYYDKVRKYHFETRKWVDCSRMYEKRCYVSASFLGGKIYACGGLDGHSRLNTAEEYDIASNSWNQARVVKIAYPGYIKILNINISWWKFQNFELKTSKILIFSKI